MPDYNTSLISTNAKTREKEEKRIQERRRSLMYLITEFLREQGYTDSVETIVKEAHLSGDYQICENIDLDIIFLEYTDYYYAKCNRYPKICRKVETTTNNNAGQNLTKKVKSNKNLGKQDAPSDQENPAKIKSITKDNNVSTVEPNFEMIVTPILQQSKVITQEILVDNEKILKPIGSLYQPGSEWREIAEIICREIVLKNLNVHWDDIKGLDNCKTLLKEATVYPVKYPELFNKKFTPWQGILLYGPPGTGKTMLAKAVATECKMTFFNITSSSLVSKWRGDSEKYVRVLYDLAKHYAPAIIFIDEIDWTAAGNEDSATKSEPTRRFRAELLARLDGLLSMENTHVLLLAASNVPWELDVALLRRLEKRILVDLPNRDTRLQILQHYVHENVRQTEKFFQLLQKTEGYSCAELKLLCKEAWLNQLRPHWISLESKNTAISEITDINFINKICYLEEAMTGIKPITVNLAQKCKQWNYGKNC